VTAYPVCTISVTATIHLAMLAGTIIKMECHVGHFLQADGDQFQHLLKPNYMQIYQGMCSPNSVLIAELLRD
jgi:hypothetical protein